jgi:hypothetical protein
VGEDANYALLDDLAGDGRAAARVSAADGIADAFLAELLAAEGEGRILTGRREIVPGPAPDPPGGEELPPVEGLVKTWARDGASVWHTDREGNPITAGMRYGLGRSAVVTTDPLGPWAPAWADLPVLPALAARTVRPASRTGPRTDVLLDGPRFRLVLRRPVREARVPARIEFADGTGRDLTLAAVGPDRYEAVLVEPPAGAARLRAGGEGDLLDGGISVPGPSEYRSSGPDPEALESLRALLGPDRPRERSAADASWVPALLALLLFLLDRLAAARRGRSGLKPGGPGSR